MLTPAQQVIAVRVWQQMSAAHERLYSGCSLWRNESDALVDGSGWRWYGCPDHALTTNSGIAGGKQQARGKALLRAS